MRVNYYMYRYVCLLFAAFLFPLTACIADPAAENTGWDTLQDIFVQVYRVDKIERVGGRPSGAKREVGPGVQIAKYTATPTGLPLPTHLVQQGWIANHNTKAELLDEKRRMVELFAPITNLNANIEFKTEWNANPAAGWQPQTNPAVGWLRWTDVEENWKQLSETNFWDVAIQMGALYNAWSNHIAAASNNWPLGRLFLNATNWMAFRKATQSLAATWDRVEKYDGVTNLYEFLYGVDYPSMRQYMHKFTASPLQVEIRAYWADGRELGLGQKKGIRDTICLRPFNDNMYDIMGREHIQAYFKQANLTLTHFDINSVPDNRFVIKWSSREARPDNLPTNINFSVNTPKWNELKTSMEERFKEGNFYEETLAAMPFWEACIAVQQEYDKLRRYESMNQSDKYSIQKLCWGLWRVKNGQGENFPSVDILARQNIFDETFREDVFRDMMRFLNPLTDADKQWLKNEYQDVKNASAAGVKSSERKMSKNGEGNQSSQERWNGLWRVAPDDFYTFFDEFVKNAPALQNALKFESGEPRGMP